MKPQTQPKPAPNRVKGALFVLIAWIFFTLVVALSRIAGEKTPIPNILFFQNFVSMLVILPWMIRKGGKSLYLSKIGVIVLRSLAGFINYAFLFLAVQRIPLVNVVLISNTAPFFIPLIIWLWKRVKITKSLWTGIIIGFVGIAFILQPDQMKMNIGMLFALGSAISLSISIIAQRRLVKSEPIHTILFYYFLISVIISLPFSFESWSMLDGETVSLLILIGLLFVTGQLFFLSSLKYEKPSFLSSFNYSAVIYSVIIEGLFWGQFPSWMTIIGIVIVCTGGIITITRGKFLNSVNRDRSSR